MSAPLAVSPSMPVPGLWLTVDLLRGSASPGALGLKAVIFAPKNTTGGDIVAGTEIRTLGSADDAKTAAGAGSLPHLIYKALFANDSQAQVDLVCPAESVGAAAAGTFTFSGAPTSNMTIRLFIHGRSIDIPWNVGETTTQIRDKAFPLINQKTDDLHVTASAGAAGVVNLTAKAKGPHGNDIAIRTKVIAGAGGACAASGAFLTGGTTEPDFTTALSTIAGREYDYIAVGISNAEAQSNGGSTNQARVVTHINTYNNGLNAKLQQCVLASTGSIASAKVGAIGRNSVVAEHVSWTNAESLPCEFSGAEIGDRMRRRRLNPNSNRIGTKLKALYGSADPVGDDPTITEAQDSLDNGVTIGGYTANGELVLIRPITTHSQDSSGNPDKRCFDVNEVDAMYDYAKDLRSALPQEFGTAKITKNRVEGDEELPEGVVEERDVSTFIVDRTLNFWVPKGVIDGTDFRAAVAGGQLIVQVNASDPTQVDVFIPAKPFKILAKIGLYLGKVG